MASRRDSASDTGRGAADSAFYSTAVRVAQKLRSEPQLYTDFMASLPQDQAAKRPAEATKDDSAKKAKKKAFTCGTCNASFTIQCELKIHKSTCTSKGKGSPKKDSKKKTFKCRKCNKKLSNKASLKRHVQTMHKQKHKCHLCNNEYIRIGTHYRNMHKIVCAERILVKDGQVGKSLTNFGIEIKCGGAHWVWFQKQLEEAATRYKDVTCRLCDFHVPFDTAALLTEHYTGHHKIGIDSLDKVKRLFRVDIKELNMHNEKVHADTKKKVLRKTRRGRDNDRTMYVCKCGLATESYDASVEHAQDHIASKYVHDKKMCNICKFSFEAATFADHASRRCSDVKHFKKIEYDFNKLLTEAWFEMFTDTATRDIILSTSVYRDTRSVRMHLEDLEVPDPCNGAPLYRCCVCQFFVDPAEIEDHCKIDNCASNEPEEHYCEKCSRSFYSANALTIHKNNHVVDFKLITFNDKRDAQINKTLEELKNNSRSTSPREPNVQKKRKIPENRRITNIKVTQFCMLCEQSVDDCLFETHMAKHRREKGKRTAGIMCKNGNARNPSNSVASRQTESATREKTGPELGPTQGKEIDFDRIENDGEGSVETWDSDTNSGNRSGHFVHVVRADVHRRINKQ